MNKKEAARKMLSSYLIWKSDIENIDLEIEELRNNYDMSGMKLEERTGPTYKISSIPENMFVNREPNIEQFEKTKRFNEINCNKVENAVKILKEFEKEVIELKYMTPPVMSWYTIARKTGFTQVACKSAENRAVKKMIPLLVR
ncbi:MAG: putative sigma factor [Anaerocolumna sp.]|nr:putative sigma factor [Anaerocolumna sp.]